MKRVITSFRNANKDVLREISAQYPKGVEDEDLINFPTLNGNSIRALEIEVGDTLYLVKMEDENYYRKFLAKDEEEDEDEEESVSSDDDDTEEFEDIDDVEEEVDDEDDDPYSEDEED